MQGDINKIMNHAANIRSLMYPKDYATNPTGISQGCPTLFIPAENGLTDYTLKTFWDYSGTLPQLNYPTNQAAYDDANAYHHSADRYRIFWGNARLVADWNFNRFKWRWDNNGRAQVWVQRRN